MTGPSRLKAACYVRISLAQRVGGQDLANQLVPIREFAEARGFDLVAEYADEGVSGAKERRPGLDQCVADARRGKFKVLIVMEISRLARDVRHLLNLLHEMDEIGTSVVSIREGLSFDSAMGRAMVAMVGIFMSVERQLLAERIRTSLATKKLTAERTGNGWRCGRPTLSPEVIAKVRRRRNEGFSIRAIAKELGIGKTSVERILRAKAEEPDVT